MTRNGSRTFQALAAILCLGLLGACAPFDGPRTPLSGPGGLFGPSRMDALSEALILGLVLFATYALWRAWRRNRNPTPQTFPYSSATNRLRRLRVRARGFSGDERILLQSHLLDAWEALEQGDHRALELHLERSEAHLAGAPSAQAR